MNTEDYMPTAIEKGHFSRAALVHSADKPDQGAWVILVERASDKATLWTIVTVFGADNLETREEEPVRNYLSCKLHNAFGKCEDMVTRSIPVNIEASRGMFETAICMQPRVEGVSKFSFLERLMLEEFRKYAAEYGCEVFEVARV